MYSSFLPANQTELKDHVIVASESFSLSDLLMHIQDTTDQAVNADGKTCLKAYHELKKDMQILYTLNDLHPNEGYTIEQTVDECYASCSCRCY